MLILRIPRHACSPRDTARAGDLWRLTQEAAVEHSSVSGWTPARYRTSGNAFVVRQMAGVHHREANYGEDLPTRTWVAENRRDVLMRRETRMSDVFSTSVEWVHVGPSGEPQRCPPDLAAIFPVDPCPPPMMPRIMEDQDVPFEVFSLEPWWTEMDPLGHTNHPRYVDWVDEAISRHLARAGRDPLAMVPVADQFRFRSAAQAGQKVEIQVRQRGVQGGDTLLRFDIRADSVLCANGYVVRRLP